MDNAEMKIILDFIKDRFDGIDHRLDQQRGAIELWSSSINSAIIKQKKHQSRLEKLEEWVKNHGKIAERREEGSSRRRDRWAMILSGLIGAATVYGLGALTGIH